MGLDVHLYQFKDADTEVILMLSRLAEEPYGHQEFAKWKAMPSSERGSFPSEKSKTEGHQRLLAKAREFRFPEGRFAQPGFGGTKISFPSARHPELPVGDWYSFSTTRELMEFFTEKNIYFVFPEAKGDPWFLRPDWAASRKRLAEILGDLQKLKPEHFQDFYAQFVKPQLPSHLLEKVKPEELATTADMLAGHLVQIEVMIETLDYVLTQERPHEFLLRWSA